MIGEWQHIYVWKHAWCAVNLKSYKWWSWKGGLDSLRTKTPKRRQNQKREQEIHSNLLMWHKGKINCLLAATLQLSQCLPGLSTQLISAHLLSLINTYFRTNLDAGPRCECNMMFTCHSLALTAVCACFHGHLVQPNIPLCPYNWTKWSLLSKLKVSGFRCLQNKRQTRGRWFAANDKVRKNVSQPFLNMVLIV